MCGTQNCSSDFFKTNVFICRDRTRPCVIKKVQTKDLLWFKMLFTEMFGQQKIKSAKFATEDEILSKQQLRFQQEMTEKSECVLEDQTKESLGSHFTQ